MKKSKLFKVVNLVSMAVNIAFIVVVFYIMYLQEATINSQSNAKDFQLEQFKRVIQCKSKKVVVKKIVILVEKKIKKSDKMPIKQEIYFSTTE